MYSIHIGLWLGLGVRYILLIT